ncbi:MAG: type VI secretion system tube protein Hcp [Cyanobacteria bacterium REEB65]|nr:type VI secretion system tube protein Hcp [Cyanobacteria bacterium REEB65]
MPGNSFIKFVKDGKDIQGESFQEGHSAAEGWLELSDWSWDIEAETSFLKGSGAAVGRPHPGNLSITHNFDNSSTAIMNNIVLGTHFDLVQIDMLKQTGHADGKPQVYFSLVASSVFVNKVSSKCGEDGAATQDVEFVFKEVAIGYKKQKQEGGLDKMIPFLWNIAQMNNNPLKAKVSF